MSRQMGPRGAWGLVKPEPPSFCSAHTAEEAGVSVIQCICSRWWSLWPCQLLQLHLHAGSACGVLSAWCWCPGAFGTVFRARLDDVLPVAVKMLESGSLGQKEIGALMNEVRDGRAVRAACRG